MAEKVIPRLIMTQLNFDLNEIPENKIKEKINTGILLNKNTQ